MSTSDDETIWKALADPTRRAILDLLKIEPRTTGEVCERFEDLSRCGVMKHLGVLEEAGLVVVRREGRFRWNHLNPVPIQQIYDRWLSRHVQPLASALTGLKRHVEGGTKKSP
jgi:DNA-binding transcriptional ArsR family regulator